MGIAVSLISLGLQAKSYVDQRKEQKKQAQIMEATNRERQEQAKLEQKQIEVKNARERRQRIREFLIARGEQENQAAVGGVSASSGAVGGMAGLGSQLGSQLGFQSFQTSGASAVSASNARIAGLTTDYAQSQGREATAGMMGQVGNTIFNATGGFSENGKIWDLFD